MLFFFCKLWYIKQAELMQVSPSGMASASQADFGGSDSRHLLQISPRSGHSYHWGRESDPEREFCVKQTAQCAVCSKI